MLQPVFYQTLWLQNCKHMFLHQMLPNCTFRLQFWHIVHTVMRTLDHHWPSIARSLWAGLMTWRQHISIIITRSVPGNYFHILEPLFNWRGEMLKSIICCTCICTSLTSLSDYNVRHTGNRGIEAIRGMFWGGTCSLPITSPNFNFIESFYQRWTKYNKYKELNIY